MKEQEIQSSMNKSGEATQRNFNTIRTGRANASLLDRISVEYYGAETPIKSLATISTVDSQTISIQPFDISCLQAIEKSISMSDLGITPNNDGKLIRINVPPLTEERRKEFCKLASKYAEEGKVALRNIRRDAVDKEKKEFHKTLKKMCDHHNKKYYTKYKKWCDEYFYLPHRGEARGIGGIFFDYKKDNFEKDFKFVRDVGVTFQMLFNEIIKKKIKRKWTFKDKEFQYIKRGRYAEFNLLYDRGTKFGLQTGGNVEGILMSLPPIAKWK